MANGCHIEKYHFDHDSATAVDFPICEKFRT